MPGDLVWYCDGMTDTPSRITHVEVAQVLGLNVATVSRVRRGLRGVSVPTLMRFANEYGIDSNELLHAQNARHEGRPEAWIALLETALGPASPTDER